MLTWDKIIGSFGYMSYLITWKFSEDLLPHAHVQKIMYILHVSIAPRIIGVTEYLFHSQSGDNLHK